MEKEGRYADYSDRSRYRGGVVRVIGRGADDLAGGSQKGKDGMVGHETWFWDLIIDRG